MGAGVSEEPQPSLRGWVSEREAFLESLPQVESWSRVNQGWGRGWQGALGGFPDQATSQCPECQPDPEEGGLATLNNLQNPRNLPGRPVPSPSQCNPVTTHQIPEREFTLAESSQPSPLSPKVQVHALRFGSVIGRISAAPMPSLKTLNY